MTPILPRNLENIWDGATDAQKLTARTEARVMLDNLVHYSGRASYENDIVLAAATLLWFRKLSSDNLNDQSNIMSEEQVAKLARQLNDIVQKFHLGITEPNEMLGDLVVRLQEAGVRL